MIIDILTYTLAFLCGGLVVFFSFVFLAHKQRTEERIVNESRKMRENVVVVLNPETDALP